MWTYLFILLSASLIAGVLARRIYLYIQDSKKVKVEDLQDAEFFLRKINRSISKEDRQKIDSLCASGLQKIKDGNEDEAIKDFVQILALDELHLEAQHRLAVLYMQKQMYSAAIALLKNLVAVEEDAMHYSHLGLAYYQQNMFEDALEAYQKAVDLDSSRPQRFVSLSQVYRSLGQLQNAVIALNKAVEMDNENKDYLFLLVDVLKELKSYKEALEILKRMEKVDNESREIKSYIKEIKKLSA